MSCSARFQPEGPRTQGGKGRAGQAGWAGLGGSPKVRCPALAGFALSQRQGKCTGCPMAAPFQWDTEWQARTIWNSGTLGAGSFQGLCRVWGQGCQAVGMAPQP